MKNKPFGRRLRFAWNGIIITLKTESSFRTQIVCSAGTLALLVFLRPAAIWWAILMLTIGAVLAAELINTALEAVLDQIHPEQHPIVGKAKDCAAGAVLVLSLSALAVAGAMIWNRFKS